MPLIAFPEARAVPDAPAAVTGNPRAPTADYGNVRQAATGLARAAQADEIDPAPFMAPGRGLEAAGRGLTAIGEVMAKLKEAREEAEDDTAVANGQRDLDLVEASFVKDREKMDPAQWEDSYAERRRVAIDSLLNNDKLSKKARHRLELLSTKWDGNQALRTAESATLTMGQRAEDSVFAGIAKKRMAGDFAGAENDLAMIEQNQKDGKMRYVNPRRIQAEREQNKHDQEKAEYDAKKQAIYDAATTDPEGYLKGRGGKRDDDTPPELDAYGVNLAQQAIRETKGAAIDGLQDGMALGAEDALADGAIVSDWQIDQYAKEHPGQITPEVVQRAKAQLARLHNYYEVERNRANAPEIRSRLMSEIKQLEPETMTAEQYESLSDQITALPAGYRELPRDLLRRKWNRSQAEETAEERSMLNYGDNLLDSMMKQQLFVPYEKTIPVTDSRGAQAYDDNGNPKTKMVRDEAKYREALTEKQTLGGKFERYYRQQERLGKPMDEQAIKDWLDKNVSDKTRLQALKDYSPGWIDSLTSSVKKAAGGEVIPPGGYAYPNYIQNPDGTVTTNQPPEKESPEETRRRKKAAASVPYAPPDLPENPGPASSSLLPRPAP